MADLEVLESSVDDLEGDFVGLEERVVQVERTAAVSIEEIGALKGQIVELKRTIGELENRMAQVANKMTTWAAQRLIDARRS